MVTINSDKLREALYPSGSWLVHYNEQRGSYTFMRLFFKALGHMKESELTKKIKAHLPTAKVIKVWTLQQDKDRMSAYECVEVKI